MESRRDAVGQVNRRNRGTRKIEGVEDHARGLQFAIHIQAHAARPAGAVVNRQHVAPASTGQQLLLGRDGEEIAFTADVANLSRIVTLQNVNITPVQGKDAAGALVMEATARTYRYLDATEIAEQRQVAAAKVAGAKK